MNIGSFIFHSILIITYGLGIVFVIGMAMKIMLFFQSSFGIYVAALIGTLIVALLTYFFRGALDEHEES